MTLRQIHPSHQMALQDNGELQCPACLRYTSPVQAEGQGPYDAGLAVRCDRQGRIARHRRRPAVTRIPRLSC